MKIVQLGRTGPRISAIGLGAMGMTPGMYGTADRTESVATLRAIGWPRRWARSR